MTAILALCVPSIAGTDCNSAKAAVGPIGKVVEPVPAIQISSSLRTLLPPEAAVIRIDTSSLSPAGEQIVLYNSSRDVNPLPVLAIVQSGKIVKSYVLRDTVKDAGAYALLLAYCRMSDAKSRNVIAVAVQISGDGSGVGFLILAWVDGEYRILFNGHTFEGRLTFLRGPTEFELWNSNDDGECVWCPQHYTVSTYRLQNDAYVKTGSSKPTQAYNPGEISETPVMIKSGKPTP
jgi:hypothetical protein